MNDATPWVDPELIAAGKLLQNRGLVAPDRTQASLAEVRAATDRIGAFLGEGSVPLERERDLTLPGPHGQVPCRLYLPDDADKPPLLIYAHGGGFMQGSLPSWDAMLRELVRQSGVAALSVDYKLSPEHRFPVAFDETVAMVRLAAREGAGLGIDPARLAIGGDSAGANLALAAAAALRNAGEGALGFMLLIYGCYSTDTESASWQRFGRGAGLSQTQMRWIWETYLERPQQQNDWRAAPILADPAGLPPAHLIVGSLDPLFDDSHRLAARLKEAGVPCRLTVYDGINHGFIRYGRLIATARRAVGDCAAALRNALVAAR
ncbi:MAG TPA: alpha/beta hydrolase [Stellaceae bacterium]|jgi:acetyl esterase|nr:alpha/beta hydrolase [Stellaceae bacterium]